MTIKFKERTLRAIADMVVGNVDHFPYRSSSIITEFFEDCGLNFRHDGSTRSWWAAQRLDELLKDPPPAPNTLPERFVHVLRVLMHKSDAKDDDPNRDLALAALNIVQAFAANMVNKFFFSSGATADWASAQALKSLQFVSYASGPVGGLLPGQSAIGGGSQSLLPNLLPETLMDLKTGGPPGYEVEAIYFRGGARFLSGKRVQKVTFPQIFPGGGPA